MNGRAIIHADLDAFFASVEQLDQPQLKGRPVIVGGSAEARGVVSAASYEARRFGVRSAQPMVQARKCCPHGVFLPVRMERYRALSRQVLEVFHSCAPLVEPISIDEAFLDVTALVASLEGALPIARSIKARIREDIGLSCSVGLAANRFLAKIASDWDKPDGLVVISKHEQERFLTDLPVGRMWGVGPAAERILATRGIRTVGHLRQLSRTQLRTLFGVQGLRLYQLSRGLDDTPVTPHHETKSIGSETTFPRDIRDKAMLERTLYQLCGEVAARLQRKSLWAEGVQLKVRFHDFSTVTRRRTFQRGMNTTSALWVRVRDMARRQLKLGQRPVRLVGVSAFGLGRTEQLDLFSPPRDGRLDRALGLIQSKYGTGAVQRGSMIGKESQGGSTHVDFPAASATKRRHYYP